MDDALDGSILNDIKDDLGVNPEDTAFDKELLLNLNAVMMILYQFGIGPEDEPFTVSSANDTWRDLLGGNPVGGVRKYVSLRIRMLFDPPSNNQLMAALKEQMAEFEWRILFESDKKDYEDE